MGEEALLGGGVAEVAAASWKKNLSPSAKSRATELGGGSVVNIRAGGDLTGKPRSRRV